MFFKHGEGRGGGQISIFSFIFFINNLLKKKENMNIYNIYNIFKLGGSWEERRGCGVPTFIPIFIIDRNLENISFIQFLIFGTPEDKY